MMTDEMIVKMVNESLKESTATYSGNLAKLGYVDFDHPNMISIYPKDFEDKEKIVELISSYNDAQEENDKITYTDTVALLMSSVTTIINAISYVLIAFVAISLVVSSIMIGIITYISVLERTKEIGILRAIGASKKDISRVFNAETFIVGLAAGIIGIGATLLLNIVINIILFSLTGLATLKATLPVAGAIILVAISVGLTLIAGLIPSRVAAKKDPVIALRTE
jgi:putative ABC transport system permease protein